MPLSRAGEAALTPYVPSTISEWGRIEGRRGSNLAWGSVSNGDKNLPIAMDATRALLKNSISLISGLPFKQSSDTESSQFSQVAKERLL